MQSVNGLEAARAALAAGVRVLCSPPYAACHAGVNYYRAMLEPLRAEYGEGFTFMLCCGDDPAIAHDALRLGFTDILCDCSAGMFAELQALAQPLGARVRNGLDPAPHVAIPDKR